MNVSPVQKHRKVNGNKSTIKKQFLRQIRLEQLERRELMAADVLPFHNQLYAHDVDGDFQISPLDALVVINELNATGARSLEGQSAFEDNNRNFDVDADNALTPLDALSVINRLNSAEGEPFQPLVGVRYEFFRVNADGSVGAAIPDSNPGTPQPDAVIGTGERIIVRTTMSDLRTVAVHGTLAQGIFAGYHDLNITNADNSPAERLQLQWGEYNRLTINQTVTGGSFTLRYGTRVTAPIVPKFVDGVLDPSETLTEVKSKLEAVFGAGNVRVSFESSDTLPDYAISFTGSEARKNIVPEGVVDSDNLIASFTPRVTLTTQSNPLPTDDVVTAAALNHNIDNGNRNTSQGPKRIHRYTNGVSGALQNPNPSTPETRSIVRMGGFASPADETLPASIAQRYLGIVEALFVGASAGSVNLTGSISALGSGSNVGIAVYGAQNIYLQADQVILPSGTITIVDRLTAVNDPAPVVEDTVTTLNVGNNDVEVNNFPFGIISITQPTNGAGSVVIGTGTNPKSVVFTPTADFFGTATFTYTIESSRGDRSTATVSLDVAAVNDPPVVVTGGLTYNVDEDATSPLVISPTNVFSPGPANESSQTLSLSIVTPPTAAQGTATINTTGGLEFVPAADFFGTVNIVVRGTDSGPNSPVPNSNNTLATLTITVNAVNDAPQIVGTAFSVTEDLAAGLTITPAQLFTPGPANESSQAITLSIIGGPTTGQGTASIVGGSLQFSPATNFFGSVIMTVRGTDNGTPALSTDSTITIAVTNVNDAPIATNDAFNVIALGDPNTLTVLANDLPGPGGEPGTVSVISVTGVTPSTSGTVAVAPGGAAVVFTPSTSPSVFGTTATFNYTVNDQAGLSATATVTVTILPPASPFAVDDDYRSNASLIINEDASATFDVLANDFSRGTKSLTAGTTPSQPQIISGPGSVAIEGNLIRYTPEANRFGEVVFTYAMDDTDTTVEANERRVATATILVQAVNDAPIAADKTIAATEDTTLEVKLSDLSLSSGAFENDSLVFISPTLTNANAGSIAFTTGAATFNFIPTQDFFGQALVTYSVRDNGTPPLTSSVATITINVAPVNDPPVTTTKTLTAVEDTQRTFNILQDIIAGDVAGPANEVAAPQSQTVSFVALTGPIATTRGGTITQTGENTLSYTPAGDFNGIDTFVYTVTDGQSANATAVGTVTINVAEVNDAPEQKTEPAKRVKVQVFAGLPTTIDLSTALSAANWSRGAANEASQNLALKQKVTDPSVGTVSDFGTTQFTYFAPLNTDTTTSFNFTVEDNGATSGIGADPKTALATIEIQVFPFQPSSFRGTVFLDDDGDGVQDRVGNDPIEAPIGGVEVTLSYMDPLSRSMKVVTEMTAADGSYDFELLPPAEFTVSYSTPQHMVNGPNTPTSFSKKINAPGGVNSVFNFPVQSIKSEYVTYLDFLASSFNQNEPGRRRGMHAAISAQGTSDWVSYYGKPTTSAYYEVVLSQDNSQAYLTEVGPNGNRLRTATLDRRQFFRMATNDGGQMVRILRDPSEIANWVDVNRNNPGITAAGYLKTVDDFFRQEGWDN